MRIVPALLLAGAAAAIAGCGSSSSSTSASAGASTPSTPASTTTAAGVNPNAPESLPPGDIPDTAAYPPYAVPGLGLTVSTPEGWSRKPAPGGLIFSDKLNAIRLEDVPATGPITVASATSTEVPKLASTVKGFKLQSVTLVSRPAGPAVRIAYLGYSQPDSVTGKFGVLAFERYEFAHKGREVSLILSAPNGSDNVDPWKKVTTSLRFTR